MPQKRPDGTRVGADPCFPNDAQIVIGAESPPLRLLGHLHFGPLALDVITLSIVHTSIAPLILDTNL